MPVHHVNPKESSCESFLPVLDCRHQAVSAWHLLGTWNHRTLHLHPSSHLHLTFHLIIKNCSNTLVYATTCRIPHHRSCRIHRPARPSQMHLLQAASGQGILRTSDIWAVSILQPTRPISISRSRKFPVSPRSPILWTLSGISGLDLSQLRNLDLFPRSSGSETSESTPVPSPVTQVKNGRVSGPQARRPGSTYPGAGPGGLPREGRAWRNHPSNRRYQLFQREPLDHTAVNTPDRCATQK